MIRVLEDRVVNKIAAGEVVERPASVVKELVENSLDAGASRLRVELQDGGRKLVRVTDDGSGMSRVDAQLCLERHATSKISTEEDLFRVQTLGFRGEALPSIAAVGRFELQTRRAEDEAGTQVMVDGGRLVRVGELGCPVGTRISLRSLFYNVPVRRKFLRTAATELSHCVEAVRRQALVRPELDVEVVHGGRTLLRAPPVADLAARALDVVGKDAEELVPVDFSDGPLRVWGLASPVGVHRGSGGGTWLYVNGRYVRDPVVRRGVREAYRGAIPRGRFPVLILLLELPPDHVDVNVHPAKTEVRFQYARDLVQALSDGLREVLQGSGLAPRRGPVRYTLDPLVDGRQGALPLVGEAGAVFERAGAASAASSTPTPAARPLGEPSTLPPRTAGPGPEVSPRRPPTPFPAEHPSSPRGGWTPPPLHPGAPSPPSPTPAAGPLPVARFADLRVLGQHDQRWILAEGAGVLVLIDQAAAHRAVTAARLRAGEGRGAALAEPVVLELSGEPSAALLDRAELLGGLGLELEPFGGEALVLKAMPEPLGDRAPAALVARLARALVARRGSLDRAGLAEILAELSLEREAWALSPYELRTLLRALDEAGSASALEGRVFACLDGERLRRLLEGG